MNDFDETNEKLKLARNVGFAFILLIISLVFFIGLKLGQITGN